MVSLLPLLVCHHPSTISTYDSIFFQGSENYCEIPIFAHHNTGKVQCQDLPWVGGGPQPAPLSVSQAAGDYAVSTYYTCTSPPSKGEGENRSLGPPSQRGGVLQNTV